MISLLDLGGKIVTTHSCIGRKEKVMQVNKVWNKETSVFNLFCHHGKKKFHCRCGASKKSGFALRISLVEVEGCRRGVRTSTFTLIFISFNAILAGINIHQSHLSAFPKSLDFEIMICESLDFRDYG